MSVDIRDIRRHYDRLSYFYRIFWGDHLHHGYWENGESIPRAQIQLMERLTERAAIPRGARVFAAREALVVKGYMEMPNHPPVPYPKCDFKNSQSIKCRPGHLGAWA